MYPEFSIDSREHSKEFRILQRNPENPEILEILRKSQIRKSGNKFLKNEILVESSPSTIEMRIDSHHLPTSLSRSTCVTIMNHT
jgi:hypothetical protein